ncbi:uncharacterized protein LOC129758493 [Uranotaenia lowii]|uniref:uncharacterized protein LOC129758493 n=1 Tax=Uranotaenia lowii TaxID=190385 RepID=UPI00247AEA7F|nr:uncharacterized protein LOC129758493 [Uranotaenia lowii]
MLPKVLEILVSGDEEGMTSQAVLEQLQRSSSGKSKDLKQQLDASLVKASEMGLISWKGDDNIKMSIRLEPCETRSFEAQLHMVTQELQSAQEDMVIAEEF